MPKLSDTKPWEQQEGESAKAFGAFSLYLDMGEKATLRLVAQQLYKSLTLIGRWSKKYKWVERKAAYEADIRRKTYEEAVKKSKKMANRHISMAMKLQEKALQALEKTNPEDIDPKNLLAFIREATKLEREARAHIVQDAMPPEEKGEVYEVEYIEDIEADIYGDR